MRGKKNHPPRKPPPHAPPSDGALNAVRPRLDYGEVPPVDPQADRDTRMTLDLEPDHLAHDGLGELYPDDWSVPRPVRIQRGADRDAVGRTEPRPDRPRRADASFGKPKRIVPTLHLSEQARLRVERGVVTARVDRAKPDWLVGDVVTVKRHETVLKFPGSGRPDRVVRDDDLAVEILSVDWLEARAIDSDLAKAVGFDRLGEFARWWLAGGSKPPKEGAPFDALVDRLRRDTRAAWVTKWSASHDVRPRWLAPQTGLGYVESAASGLPDAGVCVPAAFQREITAKAQASIGAGAKKGREKTAREEDERRKLNKAAYRVKARPAPRRVARKATLPRGEGQGA